MISAAIDIGTVTCRLFVAEGESRIERELLRECRITNLGIGVSQTGVLSFEAIDRVVECVMAYKALCDLIAHDEGLDEIPITAVATSAARDAKNADELIDRLAQVGIVLDVIPGALEAELSFRGASIDFPDEQIVVVDVGGGSTEFILGSAERGVEFARSFDIGCRRITEMFIQSDPPSENELVAARDYVLKSFAPLLEIIARLHPVQRVVAVAGTATSVVSVDLAMEPYDPARVHKAIVPRETLDAVFRLLASMTEEQRKEVVGLEPKRASVIVAGMLILQCALQVLGQTSFTVSESDILQGIIMTAWEKNRARMR
jgi:exopolyphosphatase/guanosine-5'-triphosphate,3'-diphosphate pyrophosphatase